MGKKNKEKKDFKKYNVYSEEYNNNIIEENIGDICTHYMKIFGSNINILRHTPFVIDGLKPCARRLLYTMWDIYRARHDDKFKKVATIASNTLSIHPHSSMSVEEVLCRLAQPWNNIQCCIQANGNVGGINGASPAAGRYLEARMSQFAYKCFFEDFDKDICNMKDAYSGDFQEPEFLPARYPNVIINNAFGIGYGVMTSIPTFNFKEVCKLTIRLIKDPNIPNIYLIPDITTGCDVVDEGQFSEICKTGKGKFKMRGEVEIHDDDHSLTIKSIPTKTSSDSIKEEILEKVVPSGKLPWLVDIADKSGERNVDLKLIFKKEADMKAIVHILYKNTQLERTEAVKFAVIDDYSYEPKTLREILVDWIDYRREIKRRIYNKKYVKYEERLHILETLLFILNGTNLEKTTTIVKKSRNVAEISKSLMKEYGISSLQAKKIADMKLSGFTKDARDNYKKEYDDLQVKIDYYKDIMLSKSKVDEIIIDEILEGIKLFGEPRRSKVITIENEETISNSNHIVVVTHNGYIKKLPSKIKDIGTLTNGDYPIEICHINNLNDLLIFDKKGKVFKLKVSSIPATSLDSVGYKLTDYIKIQGEVRSIIPKPTKEEIKKIEEKTKNKLYLVMITKNGIIKKTLASKFSSVTSELISIVLKDTDELMNVITVIGDKDIVVYTNNGIGIRFNTDTFKETARTSIGVKAIDLSGDEYVVGMTLVNKKDKYLFMLSEKGFGKLCTLKSFSTMDRNSKPLKLVTLTNRDNLKIVECVTGKEQFKVFMRSGVITLDMDEVQELPRLSKGVKLVPVRKGENIIDIREVK